MEEDEREILFGGYNASGQWVEGLACRDEDNTDWLIIGPFMQEETNVQYTGNVYQYTNISINGQMVFDRSRIRGDLKWINENGNQVYRQIDDKVVWRNGSWMMEVANERLADMLEDRTVTWDVKVEPPKEK